MKQLKYKITLLCTFISFIVNTLYTKSACIIVHGTWAKNESWYQPNGNFFYEIELANQYLNLVDEVISFSWSGKLGDLAQIEAGKKLAEKILEYESVILIGHSHGVTVGILSSIFISEMNSAGKFFKKIKKFYALGLPVDRTYKIYPDMKIIEQFYNIFSFGDMIQSVHGVYDRCLKQCSGITNIAAQLDDLHPDHSALHCPAIGKHLLAIPEFYKDKKIGNFEKFQQNRPAQILFYKNNFPSYQYQDDQDKKLELDKLAFELLQYAFFRTKKEFFHE